MIDFKKTIINLHKMFPEYDLDKLIEITDAIVEMPNYSYETKKPWWLAENNQTKITNEDINKWTDWKTCGIQVENPSYRQVIK